MPGEEDRCSCAVPFDATNAFEADGAIGIALCDRGTLDGLAYWPGGYDELMRDVHTTTAAQLARYDAVIHLQTPGAGRGYDHRNSLRVETAGEAARLDEEIAAAWAAHPRRFVVASRPSFLAKAAEAIELIRSELPPCCRHHRMEAGLHSGTPPPGDAAKKNATH